MPYTSDVDDAFASTKTPSLSWKGLPVGTIFTLEVLQPAKILHSRNFETGQPDYWDPPLNQNPKLSAVVNVRVLSGPHSVGEERSVWAQRPSALYAAVADAQKTAGAKLAPGGTLHLKFSGETPHENKRYSAIKNYQAKYDPPADGFYETPAPQSQYAQPYQTPPSGQTAATPLPDVLCEHPALPGAPRQTDGRCTYPAITLLAGHRICAAHKAQVEARLAPAPAGSVPF
jgi:hypothetical protein